MKKSNINDCIIFNIENYFFNNDCISSLFTVKRIYYLYDVPNLVTRGGHAHKNLSQLILPINGSFDIHIDDSISQKCIRLDSSDKKSLFFPPGIWRELDNFTKGSICLVLASEKYLESDYIRDYQKFKDYKKI